MMAKIIGVTHIKCVNSIQRFLFLHFTKGQGCRQPHPPPCPPPPHASESRLLEPSLRKHPFLLALRRDEERGETDVFAGYLEPGRAVLHKTTVATKGVRTCTRNLLK